MKKAFLALGIVLAFGVVLVGFLLVSNKVDVMDNKVYYYVGTRDVDLTDETTLPEHGIESNKGIPPVFIEDIGVDLSLEAVQDGTYNDLKFTFINHSDKNITDVLISYQLPNGESYNISTTGIGSKKPLKPGDQYNGKNPFKKGFTLEMLTPEEMMLSFDIDGKKVMLTYYYITQTYEWIV